MERILIFGTDAITQRILTEIYGNPNDFSKNGGVGFVDNIKKDDIFLGGANLCCK